jgi:hypothetical protein
MLDAAPDSLPHQLSPCVASFPIKALSEGHDSSRIDVSRIGERGVIENPSCADLSRFSTRRGGTPELSGVNRWEYARTRLRGGIDGQNEHLGRHSSDGDCAESRIARPYPEAQKTSSGAIHVQARWRFLKRRPNTVNISVTISKIILN